MESKNYRREVVGAMDERVDVRTCTAVPKQCQELPQLGNLSKQVQRITGWSLNLENQK